MTCPYLSAPRLLPPPKDFRAGYSISRDDALDAMFKGMAKQGVGIWLLRWICPACGWRRPDHAEGCDVVKQGLR